MSYQIFNDIAGAFLTVFGGKLLVALILVAVIIIILLAIKAPKVAILVIILPLISTIAIAPSVLIEIPKWVAAVLWIIVGVIMAGVFWLFIR